MIAVASVSHRNAPLALLERLAYRESDVGGVLSRLVAKAEVKEAVILSTCNRTEIYAANAVFADLERLRQFLAWDKGVSLGELGSLSLRSGSETARHLFRVTAALDSMLMGEGQIQGQVKAAYVLARQAGTVGPELDGLFRRAIAVGRRVRRETALGGVRRSLGRSAVDHGAALLGGLAGRNVLVIGAGKIARAVVDRLLELDTRLLICNRTEERAKRLAGLSAQVVPFRELRRAMARADLIICCTAAPHRLIEAEDVRQVQAARGGRSLMLVDLSIPRAIDPLARHLSGVRLIDLGGLGQRGVQDASLLSEAVRRAEAIVDEEAGHYLAWVAGRSAGAAIAALRRQRESLYREQLERALQERQNMDKATAQVLRNSLARVFHRLTMLAKEAAAAGDDNTLISICRAFSLEEASVLPSPPAARYQPSGAGKAVRR